MLTRMGFTPLRDCSLANLPGIAGFIAAQFGIQIGMMVPLSPFYFFRWPVAGAYANLIAIPLVGVVLQLSMLAGLTGLIPGIGIYIALFLSAANWIFSIGFLLIGHYFSRWFIYPFMTKPTVYDLGVYFAAVAVFAYWRPLWFRVVAHSGDARLAPHHRLWLWPSFWASAGAPARTSPNASRRRTGNQRAIRGLRFGIMVNTPTAAPS